MNELRGQVTTRYRYFFWFAAFIIFSLWANGNSQAADQISIRKDGVNIRSGPGTNSEIIWEVFKDFPLEVIKQKGKWTKVKDFENDMGWVYALKGTTR